MIIYFCNPIVFKSNKTNYLRINNKMTLAMTSVSNERLSKLPLLNFSSQQQQNKDENIMLLMMSMKMINISQRS